MRKKVEKIINIRETDLHNLRENSKKLKNAEKSLLSSQKEFLEVKDKYLRTAAEFENYRKRTEKEKREIFQFGLENFICQLIPFNDIFESVLKQMDKNSSNDVIQQGVQMLGTEFLKLLESVGVKKITSQGVKFDPNLHEASEIVETNDVEEDYILAEDRVGYILNGKIIRPALVKVAKNRKEQ
ncbi:nucleotide exchange factor GrpE [bacterium]|nr:nucleotide exchange factor GrpE [bacterium]